MAGGGLDVTAIVVAAEGRGELWCLWCGVGTQAGLLRMDGGCCCGWWLCCRRCLVAWRNIEESFLAANGNKALVSFSECQCPRGSMGTLCYKWGGGGWLSTIVNLCSTCTDRLLEGMTRSMQCGESMQPNKTSARIGLGQSSIPRCLLNTLSPLRDISCPFSTGFRNSPYLQGLREPLLLDWICCMADKSERKVQIRSKEMISFEAHALF